MQPAVLESYNIKVREEELYIGLLRVVEDNPKTMYDGSKVIR